MGGGRCQLEIVRSMLQISKLLRAVVAEMELKMCDWLED